MNINWKIADDLNSKCYHEDEAKSVCTPIALATEIVGKIPAVTGTALVISDLGLLDAYLVRLNREAISFSCTIFAAHTQDQIDACREYQDRGLTVMDIGYNDSVSELKKKTKDMKFDIVIGNPPYQPDVSDRGESAGSGNSIWQNFLELAFDKLNVYGTIAFISPPNWRIPTRSVVKRNKFATVQNLMHQHDVSYLITGAEKFFNLTIPIDAYIVHKRPYERKTVVRFYKHGDFTKELDLSTLALPIKADDITLSVLSKISSYPGKRIRMISAPGGFTPGKRCVDVSLEQSTLFCYPFVANIFGGKIETGKIAWSRIEHPHQKNPKILVPADGRYVSFPFEQGKLGFGIGVFAILVSSAKEGKNLESFLNSKIIKFFVRAYQDRDQFKFPAYALELLPRLDTQMWTDEQLYIKFGLSSKEVELIESAS